MPAHDRRLLWAVLAVIVVVGAALGVAIAWDRTSETSAPPSSSSSPTPSTSGTTASSVTTPVDTSTAVWPQVTSSIRYTDPREAATGFARDFLGFRDPVTSPFMAGDARSGEVEIRPNAAGPVTTVFVRQLGTDGEWWVLGSATHSIQIATPAALDRISSPVRLTGTSTAFEATVSVLIYADGQVTPLARTFVMGGANGEFGPFDATVEFTTPTATAGTIVLFTESMADGGTREASVLRVAFT